MIDFRKAGETGRLYRGDRCRSEAAERLPHDITRIRDSVDDPPHELQGLLIKMRRRQTARIINPWSSSFHRAFNAFHTTQGSQLPHISNSMRVTPLVSQSVPVFAGNRGFSIKGIIRPARFGAILVSVGCQALHHLTWRPVPEPPTVATHSAATAVPASVHRVHGFRNFADKKRTPPSQPGSSGSSCH